MGEEQKVERFALHLPTVFTVIAPKYWKIQANQVDAVTVFPGCEIVITALGLGLDVHNDTTITKVWFARGSQTAMNVEWEGCQDTTIQHVQGQTRARIELGVNIDVSSDSPVTICVTYTRAQKLFNGKQNPTHTGEFCEGPDGTTFFFTEPNYNANHRREGLNSLAGPIFDIYYKKVNN